MREKGDRREVKEEKEKKKWKGGGAEGNRGGPRGTEGGREVDWREIKGRTKKKNRRKGKGAHGRMHAKRDRPR